MYFCVCHDLVMCADAVTSARIYQLHRGFNCILKVFLQQLSRLLHFFAWLNWIMFVLIIGLLN